ncbi:MAG: hypothetical protein ACYC7I_03325 [Gammaproteobacteria bacterium]
MPWIVTHYVTLDTRKLHTSELDAATMENCDSLPRRYGQALTNMFQSAPAPGSRIPCLSL